MGVTSEQRAEHEARLLTFMKAHGWVRTATKAVMGAHIGRGPGLRAFWSLKHAGVIQRVDGGFVVVERPDVAHGS